MMNLLTFTALLVSAVPIILLCVGDPKRRRSVAKKNNGMSSTQRWLLAAIACVPGIIGAFSGDAAAFFMWLGGCGLVGWAATALLSRDQAC